MKLGILNVIFTFFAITASAANNCEPAFEYVVRESQTLSEILYQQNFRPLYGKDGYIEYIVELNRIKNRNKVQANEKILLKRKCESEGVAVMEEIHGLPEPKAVETQSVESTPKERLMAVAVGAGVKSISYMNQDDTENESGNFVSHFNPAFSVGYSYLLPPHWAFEIVYQRTQVHFKVPSSLTLDSNQADLQDISGKIKYLVVSSGRWSNRLVGGLEKNEILYLAPGNVADLHLLVVSLKQALIGLESHFQQNGNVSWVFEASLNPVVTSQSSAGSFKVDSGLPWFIGVKPVYTYNDKWKFSVGVGHRKYDFKFLYESESGVERREGKMSSTETEFKIFAQHWF